MAELLAIDQPGGSVGDTYQGLVILRVVDADTGQYVWKDSTLAGVEASKLNAISVTQPVDLDAIESAAAASKQKTDLISVSNPINLDHLTVTQPVDLDAVESAAVASKAKTDLISILQPVDLDAIEASVEALQAGLTSVEGQLVGTNLSYSQAFANGTVASSTGTDAIIPLADATYAGLMSPSDRVKLDSVSSGATANASDASLRDRSTHTGTQLAATISDFTSAVSALAPVTSVAGKTGAVTVTKTDVGLGNVDNTSDLSKPISTAVQTVLDGKQASLGFTPENAANKGAVNGYASLGSDGKVPSAQLPESGSYQGTWNASTNTPTIVPSTGSNGDFYLVSTAGSTNIDGISSWSVGDQIRFDGSVWQKIPNSQAVSSVAGKTGAVTLVAADVGLGNVSNVAQAPATRLVSAGSGLSGGGDLSADRTLSVSFGTTAGTACQGNDARLSDARTPLTHTHTAAAVTDFNTAAAAAAPVQTVAGRSGAVALSVADVSGAAPLASPSLTGTPVAPTPASGDNSTRIATTAFVKSQGYVTSSGVTSVSGTAPIVSSGGTTPALSISAATTDAAGSMSAADKTKMDRITIAAPQDIDTIAANAASAVAKTNQLTVTQAVDLDTMESDVAALKTKTNFMTVTQAVNLDTLETDVAANNAKTQHITVTQAVNLDTMESNLSDVKGKADFITVNTPVNLNNHQTTFGHLTVTAATDLDAIRTKANHLTVTQAVNLDTMETDVAALLADMIRLESKEVIDPRDFGAIIGDNVTEQQALDNADAIQAAIDAAYAAGFSMTTGAGADGNKLGGSINRYPVAEVVFNGLYRIAKPLWVKQQGCNINWSGYKGAIARYGPEDYFRTNHPGRWAIEVGDDLTENTTAFFVNVRGLTFAGFDRLMQLGYAPNNLNVGLMVFQDCHFVGPTLLRHPHAYGIRVFNRSSILSFDRCVWNMFDRGLEIQSIDRVFLNDCRIQIGNEIFNSDVVRPDKEAQIVLRHGRLRVNGLIGNPPLRSAASLPANGGQLKTWLANESLVKGAYRYVSGAAYRTKRALTCQAAEGSEDLTGGSADWETIPAEAQGFANIDTQRYFWIKAEEYSAWAANAEYAKGDIILQPYNTGGEAVYWSRLNYTADSGVSWTSDRANWQVIDSMKDWKKSSAVNQYDVRRALDPADVRWKFWYSNTTRTTGSGTFDATEKTNWTLIPPSGNAGTSYGNNPFTVYRTGGQPISAWNTLAITGESLFGAESGGLTPVYWDAGMMPIYTGGVEERKQHSGFYIVGNTLHSDRRIPHVDINPTKDIRLDSVIRPCVILAQHPNYMIVKDNLFSKVSDAVAIAYDPYLDTKPYLPLNNEARAYSLWDIQVKGNMQGVTGMINNFFPDNHTPYTDTYRLYSADWAPVELLCPSLNPVWRSSALSLSSVTAWAASTLIQLGEYRGAVDPADATEKLWRSRFHRTSGSGTFDATEKKFWQLVDDISLSDSGGLSYIAPVLSSQDVYRYDNPVACIISSFNRAIPGKVFTVHFIRSGATLQHVSGRMYLKGSTNVSPTWGQTITFTVIGGQIWEIGRNF